MKSTILANLGLLLVGLIATSCGSRNAVHPTDSQVIAIYRSELTNLVQVVGMLKQDPGVEAVWIEGGKIRVGGDRAANMSVERLAKYQALLERLGSTVGVHSFKGDSVDFALSSFGLSVSGSGKGIAYRERTPEFGLVGDTDAQPPLPNIGRTFRSIEGYWYVYYSE